MKWISVENEMPEEGQIILCFLSGKLLFINHRPILPQRVLRYGKFYGDGKLYFVDPATQLSYQPTHWMPLSKPPREIKDEVDKC